MIRYKYIAPDNPLKFVTTDANGKLEATYDIAALSIPFDNTGTNFVAVNVQDALEEVDGWVEDIQEDITNIQIDVAALQNDLAALDLITVLAVGNSTGGYNIDMTAGDTIVWNNGSGGILTTVNTTSNHTWYLPDEGGNLVVVSALNDYINSAGGTMFGNLVLDNADIVDSNTGDLMLRLDQNNNEIYLTTDAGALLKPYLFLDKTTNEVKLSSGDVDTALYITNTSAAIGTLTPSASALFELSSTTQGFLLPRMTGTQAEGIGSPATGLLVYATSGGGSTITVAGLWQYNGTKWVNVDSKAPATQSIVSASTVTPTANDELVIVTALATNVTLANPTGTWANGQDFLIRIKDNGTARTINYDTMYRAIGVTLPTTTVINKTLYLGVVYNSADNTFDVLGVSQEV